MFVDQRIVYTVTVLAQNVSSLPCKEARSHMHPLSVSRLCFTQILQQLI